MNLLSISQFLQRHLLWFLIAAYVIAVVLPVPGLQIRNVSFGEITIYQQKTNISLLMIMLAILMFNAGLGLNISHINKYVEKKYVLLAGLAANITIPIIYIFGVTVLMRLWSEPVEAQHILVGLALVAAMPIAGGSTAWAQNANGNLALSLGLVLFSTILSPIITPVTFNIFGEMASEEFEKVLQGLAVYGSGAFLGLWVVLPSLLGIAVRLIVVEDWVVGGMPYLKLINSIVLLMLNYSNAAVSLPQAIADQDYDFLAVTLVISAGLCLTLFAAGYGMSRLFKLDRTERVSLMFGLGMNNNGTGLVLASLALPSYPNIMVPIIFYNLVQHIAAGTVNEVMNSSVG
ncbi:bile acid:sodium symporter family protein [Candidatus Nitrotoga sp. 1052]|uniref:bile acid:sodium symporter family protein n=1 Tax=Candidatus Nitrotoga sp. 1052 TaxID=2886964 RepID=UPI001EF3F7BA|nr:bile acid:sodium symporter [Candidatus Nitrotoga sp. 1052]CAH1086183.1 Bile acid:Na+ symporter, BASS family [Candidatus Nitrotoga sp. 1052]